MPATDRPAVAGVMRGLPFADERALGAVNIDDALVVINKWQEAVGAPHASVTDVEPQIPANFNDVLILIFAFPGDPYPFGCPDDPCRDNIVNPCR